MEQKIEWDYNLFYIPNLIRHYLLHVILDWLKPLSALELVGI